MPVTWNIPTPKMVRSSKNWNNKARPKLSRQALEVLRDKCSLQVDAKKGEICVAKPMVLGFFANLCGFICHCYMLMFAMYFFRFGKHTTIFQSSRNVWSWMKLQSGIFFKWVETRQLEQHQQTQSKRIVRLQQCWQHFRQFSATLWQNPDDSPQTPKTKGWTYENPILAKKNIPNFCWDFFLGCRILGRHTYQQPALLGTLQVLFGAQLNGEVK